MFSTAHLYDQVVANQVAQPKPVDPLIWFLQTFLTIFVIMNAVMVIGALQTWAERKVIARMQLRYGPNRTGPFGLLQPIADLVKMIRKESFYPATAVDFLYITAPIVSTFTALLA